MRGRFYGNCNKAMLFVHHLYSSAVFTYKDNTNEFEAIQYQEKH
jgi:hypothetical protein